MSKTGPTIGVGVIGLGVMGRTHIRCYQQAEAEGMPCRLVAVCDPKAEKLTGVIPGAGNMEALEGDGGGDGGGEGTAGRIFDPREVQGYTEVEGILADPRVRLVSICTYTESHVDLAMRALAAGKHVLVEKPVALKSADVRRLAEAARGAGGAGRRGVLCMPAMCMRFWPGWDWLHDRIRDGSLGRLRSVTFTRLGSGPDWAAGFYRDESRSGGALVDLHIHDADFVYWCFGKPEGVTSTGDAQHVTTLYHYPAAGGGVLHVAAEGAWDLAPKAGFRMRYLANFEHATAEWDLSWKPTLRVHRKDGTEEVDVGQGEGYIGEIRHLVSVIAAGGAGERELRATLEDAVAVAEMLEAERRSLESGRRVDF